MYGRYGFDELSKVALAATLVLMVVSLFTKNRFIYLVSLILLVFSYWRALSKNTKKRQQENRKFLSIRYRGVARWAHCNERQAQTPVYRFYKCPGCGQMVRVPKGRGRICITCPKCQVEFIRKS